MPNEHKYDIFDDQKIIHDKFTNNLETLKNFKFELDFIQDSLNND